MSGDRITVRRMTGGDIIGRMETINLRMAIAKAGHGRMTIAMGDMATVRRTITIVDMETLEEVMATVLRMETTVRLTGMIKDNNTIVRRGRITTDRKELIRPLLRETVTRAMA